MYKQSMHVSSQFVPISITKLIYPQQYLQALNYITFICEQKTNLQANPYEHKHLVGEEAFFGAGDLERTFLAGEVLLGGGERPLLLFGLHIQKILISEKPMEINQEFGKAGFIKLKG